MKTCRENLNKIKVLCENLNDRNMQLKINASTLWLLLDEIKIVTEDLTKIEPDDDIDKQNLNAAIKKLTDMSATAETRGCKAIKNER
jgi:hypothetical protein